MNLRHLPLAAAGLGAAAIVACGSSPTLNLAPAAAVKAAPAGQVAERCDTGRWTGAVNPEGRPNGFDAGDAGAVYVWHDGDGWHIRTTDARPVDHHYTGTIRLEPAAANFAAMRTVRDERDDRVFVDGTNVLHYDFHTFASIDGADFRVTCPAGRDRERLSFHTDFDGRPIADRVRIGEHKQSPRTADFGFVRANGR